MAGVASSRSSAVSGAAAPQRSVRALHEALSGAAAPQLVDVRTSLEFSRGHVSGAVNIPLGVLESRLSELDASQPVWLICRSGSRSNIAAGALAARGVEAINVAGGMIAWQRAGYPVLRPPGAAAAPPSLGAPLLMSLTLGLAPFVPEPHIIGKLRWLAGGAAGMTPMDWFDLLLHGTPWLWLAWALLQRVRSRG